MKRYSKHSRFHRHPAKLGQNICRQNNFYRTFQMLRNEESITEGSVPASPFNTRPVSLEIHLVTIVHKVARYGDKFLIVPLSGLLCKFPPGGCPTRLFHLLLTAELS